LAALDGYGVKDSGVISGEMENIEIALIHTDKQVTPKPYPHLYKASSQQLAL